LDDPQHREIDVDDVLVAGEHQALFRNVARGGAAPRILDQAHADVDPAIARNFRRQRLLDRIGQMIIEAWLRELRELAEAQHHSLLVGLHAVEAGEHPECDRGDNQEHAAPAAERAAWQDALQAILAAADQLFEIGRGRAARLRTGTPGAAGPAAPRSAALVLPRHNGVSPARARVRRGYRVVPPSVQWRRGWPEAPDLIALDRTRFAGNQAARAAR